MTILVKTKRNRKPISGNLEKKIIKLELRVTELEDEIFGILWKRVTELEDEIFEK